MAVGLPNLLWLWKDLQREVENQFLMMQNCKPMRKTYFYFLGWLLLVLAGCEYNEEHFPGLDELARPVDVRILEYELTAEDYAAISGNADNVSLAEARGLGTELQQLASKQMFSETLKASDFVPAFLNKKWYQLDEKSAIKVTYNLEADRPAYLDELSGDRKSTRLNSSHVRISYAVFCLKKKIKLKSTK